MLPRFLSWSLSNPLVAFLVAIVIGLAGAYAFVHINVEAYPDPAPPIIEVIAQYPGASAEEVERLVTIPLEVTLAGMPGLKSTRSRSLFGLAHLRNQFEYWMDYEKARQEVINRLQFTQPLPTGVQPVLSPASPTGEIYRYTLKPPREESGQDYYSLNDLKALQDWTLERVFRRVPRIIDVTSAGGTVKRYEIHLDPDRLRRYGITLSQLQSAISNANSNVGADVLVQGPNATNVRGIGLYGGGLDPMRSKRVLAAKDPAVAVSYLRSEDERRVRAIRRTVVTTINNVPIRVEDLVDGGPLSSPLEIGQRGVIVGNQTRLGKVRFSAPRKDARGHEVRDANGKVVWDEDDERVQCIVLLRKGEDTLPALADVKAKVSELNSSPGSMLPGVKIEPYYDRTELVQVTTETVRENLVLGIVLVIMILFMFLSNVRLALIVAINIPLALLFAFSVLFARGKSANLLSIGAVDFGIIVDSSVIVAENIYRHLSSGEHAELPLRDRILTACSEIQKPLLFSTAIMVCAFLPLFTMRGAEGQLFGPMAETYAFALAGGLLLAVLLTPVLCLYGLRNIQPRPDNILVRFMKRSYLNQLQRCLKHRGLTLAIMLGLTGLTFGLLPLVGREFMPELEEGNLWVRGMFPRNASLEAVADRSLVAQKIMQKYAEIELVMNQMGRPDDGTDPEGFYKSEFFIPLKPQNDWPAVVQQSGWRTLFGAMRPRTKLELIAAMDAELKAAVPGVDWNFSQNIRDNVLESISGVKGDNSIKIIGPDLDELQRLAQEAQRILLTIPGIENVGVLDIMGQPNLEFPVDPEKCNRWGVSVADVENVIQTAVGGSPFSRMIEGEKSFDITLRWPRRLRDNEQAILDIPVDVSNNQVSGSFITAVPGTRITGGAVALSTYGTAMPGPAIAGSMFNGTMNYLAGSPRRRLGDLVTPLRADGTPDPTGGYMKAGASMIFREQGNRMIAVKFSVRNRDLAGAVQEAQQKTAPLIQAPYRAEWGGEFEQMQDAELRLMLIIPAALGLIFVLLYSAFGSLLDTLAVLSNVVALSLGGIWALLLTDTNFSISAAVGFISLFGVAIMDGLLLISSFNANRAAGMPLHEAILNGAEKRVRPVVMTALTAILGLLPAALAVRPAWGPSGDFRWVEQIGSQTQRPLAIVVVGGMVATLLLTRYLMPVLYSFYGHREPPVGSGDMAH
jgi:cobalt-zinc-cadmium resistance protein CzcA